VLPRRAHGLHHEPDRPGPQVAQDRRALNHHILGGQRWIPAFSTCTCQSRA
jgi:hypothetical protein